MIFDNFMRLILFFDLPMVTKTDQRRYRKFIKFLTGDGYIMLQYSVYCKLCINNDSVKKYSSSQLLNNLKKSSKNKNTLVILMHDTKDVSNSSLVLEASIKYLKSQGYTFQNFYDLIG